MSHLPTVKLLINGEFVESTTSEWRDVINPATQQVLARVPMATAAEVAAAVAAGKAAFKSWKKTPIGTRARIFLKLQQLIREHMKELAAILTAEQGKTLADAGRQRAGGHRGDAARPRRGSRSQSCPVRRSALAPNTTADTPP